MLVHGDGKPGALPAEEEVAVPRHLAISIGLLGKTSSETGTTKYLDNVVFLVTLSFFLHSDTFIAIRAPQSYYTERFSSME